MPTSPEDSNLPDALLPQSESAYATDMTASVEIDGAESIDCENDKAEYVTSSSVTPDQSDSQTHNNKTNKGLEDSGGSPIDPETVSPLASFSHPPSTVSTLTSRRDRQISARVVVSIAIAIVATGLILNDFWLTLAGSMVATVVSMRLVWPSLQGILAELTPQQQTLLIAVPGALFGVVGLMQISGLTGAILRWGQGIRWDVVGALGDFLGAFGQILIALLAVYVAWRQYVISRDLTTQQNRITQQQTIDAYFQGISDLVLDDEGLLEDWPQERSIAEARTAAILSSIDAAGKAKVIRFLSGSRLLTPLKRDRRLGRPILDGSGGYAEERGYGIRVIDLGVMLAASDLSGTDLRWTDLSDANLIRANLQGCDLVRGNLARAILVDANLAEADVMGARLFYGELETASPRTRTDIPDYQSGAYTGAVVEGADFSGVKRMSEQQRRYCCIWGGDKTRAAIPGGCGDLPNLLGR
ncbi:MAG: pentapeptide repeat-containing protein [Cyanobacteria bacterium J06635_15]